MDHTASCLSETQQTLINRPFQNSINPTNKKGKQKNISEAMDSNRKRKGFVKSKLMPPFYRASSKPSSNVQYSSNKVKPSQNSYTSTANSVGYVVHHQDYVFNPPKPNKMFIVPAEHANRHDKLSKLDKLFGVIADESVDVKAATYISSVQERFKLERAFSERVKLDDMK